MGWPKRGAMRTYNSKAGVGTMMGHHTKQVVACKVRNKDCRVCTYWNGQAKDPPVHNCQINWQGTSKGMEPDAAAEIVQQIESGDKCQIGTIIMDEDATTIARIRVELDHDITKWSDLNHIKKSVGNALWRLNKKYPKDLKSENISYLQRCFTYGIRQNKENAEEVKKAILGIVPHVYGEHNICGDWCNYKRNPEKYAHSTLNGDFTNMNLHSDLSKIFKTFADNSEKIAPCASTKENENFNHIVFSKAPKSRHYAGSESLQTRVNCAVAQKNVGYEYVSEINKATGLSPGTVTQMDVLRRAKKRKCSLDVKNTRKYKRKRLFASMKNKKSDKVSAVKEGTTYQSDIGLIPGVDVTEIPEIQNCPEKNPVKDTSITCSEVYFDIETTSLAMQCDITQISAVCFDKYFDQYVTPIQNISTEASNVTGLTFSKGVLFYNSKPVKSIHIDAALSLFLAWLSDLEPQPVLLIGHNVHKFDAPRFCNKLLNYNLKAPFTNIVAGYVDTLLLFRELYPNMTNHKQSYLVEQLLHETYGAHNSLEDVKMLQKLILGEKSKQSHINLFKHSVATSAIFNCIEYENATKTRLDTFSDIIKDKVMSTALAKRAAESGLVFQHILLAFERGGREGVQLLFNEKDSRKRTRVTNRKSIIKTVSDYLEKLQIPTKETHRQEIGEEPNQ